MKLKFFKLEAMLTASKNLLILITIILHFKKFDISYPSTALLYNKLSYRVQYILITFTFYRLESGV